MARRYGNGRTARMELPYEMIREILSWLPVKSLLRFRSVSKQWSHLITNPDPDFLKSHLKRSFLAKPGLLIVRKYEYNYDTKFYYAQDYTSCDEDELTQFEIPFKEYDYRVVNICNGLLCFTDFLQEFASKAHVWNFLTGDHITLPSSPVPSPILDCFPLQDLEIMYGFGFHQVNENDEYKLIRFVSVLPVEITDEHHSHFTVFTLGKDSSWRSLQLQHFLPYDIKLCNYSAALVNGALHWFGSKLNDSFEWDSPDTLISFNMQEESFQEIPQPDGIAYDYPFKTTVGEMGGLLYIFCGSFQDEDHVDIEIWEMGEYGVADSWGKKYKIRQPWAYRHYLTPLGVADNGEIIISRSTEELISYDPNTNLVSNLHTFERAVWETHTFRGSLLSPRIINLE